MAAPKPALGVVAWRDLTVPDAEPIARFYAEVAGWTVRPHPMGDYADFDMLSADGEVAAGVCHARGGNAGVPAQWLIYITVEDVDRSAARCRELGGRVVDGPRAMGRHRFCVVQDPAGAVAALVSDGGDQPSSTDQ